MSLLWDNDITTDTRPYVMELQGYLRTIKRARYGTTTVPMDGFYSADTAAGVRQFQQSEGLPVTGTVDAVTWDALYIAYREADQQTAPPIAIRGLRQPLLQPGDRGDAVVFLIVMLGLADTTYTTATEQAVRRVQSASLLPVTGNTDKDTWDAVTNRYNQGGLGGTSEPFIRILR